MKHNKKKLTLGITTLLLLTLALSFAFGCNGVDREDYLNGKFGVADVNPPEVLAPINNSKVTDIKNTQVTLVWTAKVGTIKYTVEIVKDDGSADPFANAANDIVEGNPFTVTVPDTSVKITLPDAWSYKWRVRSNITEEGKYGEGVLHAFDDAVYVHCPASVTCSEDTDGDGKDDTIGNKSKPFRTIQTAINESVTLEIEVHVALRDQANKPYNESFNLLVAAKLYGGYDSANWQKGSTKTKIESAELQVVMAASIKNKETIIDNLELTSIGNLYLNYTVNAQNNDSNLKIQNCIINNNSENQRSIGIFNSASSPMIFGNTISGGNGGSASYGVSNSSSSSPRIFDNTISGGSGGSASYGVSNSVSSMPVISGNIISGGSSATTSRGINNTSSAPTILNNTILGGSGGTSSYGVYNNNASPKIVGNTINGGSGTTRYGISENNGTANPASLKNNLIFDTPTGLYYDFNNIPLFDNACSTATIDFATTVACGGGALQSPTGGVGAGSGNITLTTTPSQSIVDVFAYNPSEILFSSEGSDTNTTYDGSTISLEVKDNTNCAKFVVNQYFEYFYDNIARKITATDCTTNMTVSFSPAISYDFGAGIPVLLWGTANTNYDKKYALKTTSPSLNSGLTGTLGGAGGCTAYSSKVHVWGTGSDQANCGSKYPYANSTYNAGNCETTYLHPATELTYDPSLGTSPYGNNNGLCEQGETCLHNPNMGAYAGHASTGSATGLIASSCDVTGVTSGTFNTVKLMKYENNGY